jgi:hypothetical protein
MESSRTVVRHGLFDEPASAPEGGVVEFDAEGASQRILTVLVKACRSPATVGTQAKQFNLNLTGLV